MKGSFVVDVVGPHDQPPVVLKEILRQRLASTSDSIVRSGLADPKELAGKVADEVNRMFSFAGYTRDQVTERIVKILEVS